MVKFAHKQVGRGKPFPIQELSTGLGKIMTDVGAEGKRFISKYPPQTLTKTGYRRTGTLKRSWSFKASRARRQFSVVVGSNSNIAPYNRPVQGRRQVRIFRRAGWRNLTLLQKKMEGKFVKDSIALIRRVVR